MRLFLVLTLVASASASAQGPNPKFPVYGVDYSFERMVATRTVADAWDKGTIRLTSYVYRPLKADRGQVVVVLHGSTGGMAIAPSEPNLGPGPSPGFFLERGYTVVIPMRRGRAESTGHYVEECAYQARACSLVDYRKLTEPGLADALASTEAVVDQVVSRRLKVNRFLLWGSSRGGLLALRYAADHPRQVRGVVAVSPGWLSMTEKWPAGENAARLALQRSLFARAGAAYKGPSLWVYADGDPFYPETLTRQFHAAYREAGGAGTYVQVRDQKLASGHVPPVESWLDQAKRFLDALP